jgi:hypothetical protein
MRLQRNRHRLVPPFTLASAGYAADLDVAYLKRLSRGLVPVKWWLLAIPP